LKEQKNQQRIIILIAALLLVILTIAIAIIVSTKKKLEKANHFREKIISIISHDLRSPLFALQGLNSQASYYIKKNDMAQFAQLANNIDEASVTVVSIIDNLLKWSLFQHKVNINNTEIEIQSSITKVIKLYESIATNNGILLINKSNAVAIKANVNIIELILRNWLDNVIKHTAATQIVFETKIENNGLQIVITDNGVIEEAVVEFLKTKLNAKKT
jgi:signal transduction histidine kinase